MSGDRTRLYQTIAQALLDAIGDGEFPSGSRLPGERDLAERFGVSRVTIREAEIALEARGIIDIRVGSGVYVRRAEVRNADALPDVSAFELTTARLVIEAEAAALAAVNVSEQALDELQDIVTRMAQAGPGSSEAEDLDREFHRLIAQATGNPVIEHVVAQLWRMRGELPRVQEVYASICGTAPKARTDEHAAIYDALRQRDARAARDAMREHFHRLFESMLSARENAALAELKRSLGEDRQLLLQTTLI